MCAYISEFAAGRADGRLRLCSCLFPTTGSYRQISTDSGELGCASGYACEGGGRSWLETNTIRRTTTQSGVSERATERNGERHLRALVQPEQVDWHGSCLPTQVRIAPEMSVAGWGAGGWASE